MIKFELFIKDINTKYIIMKHILFNHLLNEYYKKKKEEKNIIRCRNIYKKYLNYLEFKNININYISIEKYI